MSVIRPVQLVCDGDSPDCETGEDTIVSSYPRQTITSIRADLREEGWSYSGGKDWCPACRRARRAERSQHR